MCYEETKEYKNKQRQAHKNRKQAYIDYMQLI